MNRLSIMIGDITQSDSTAIVNATDTDMLGMSGVDGEIHRAAGPAMDAECRSLYRCQTGEAKLTAGYNLRARYVLHTVGPVWQGGYLGEANLLASCYHDCLRLAEERKINSVDFTPISVGLYRYPLGQAANIAVKSILKFLAANQIPEKVRIVCRDAEVAEAFQSALYTEYLNIQSL